LNATLFRIFQETLTNVAGHAQATRVSASLRQEGQTLSLTVHYDGRGITESQNKDPHSLGLLGLRERAAQWGGGLTLVGAPGEGTTVTVRIPLPASMSAGGNR
jgi:signal transduction histidine kinase